SWAAFDNLRQRVELRIERAFGDIAAETIRRELYFRASQLTGVPQDSQTAELLAAAACGQSGPAGKARRRSAGAAGIHRRREPPGCDRRARPGGAGDAGAA